MCVLEGMVCVHVCVRRYGVYMCVLEGTVCTCVCMFLITKSLNKVRHCEL